MEEICVWVNNSHIGELIFFHEKEGGIFHKYYKKGGRVSMEGTRSSLMLDNFSNVETFKLWNGAEFDIHYVNLDYVF